MDENRNTPEAMAARASQPDPLVMYLIIRESLEMSVGKIAAQCSHGSQMLQLKFNELQLKDTAGWTSPEEKVQIEIYQKWLDTSFRKVVLRADDHRFERLRQENPNNIVVVDAGLTEIAPGSQTVLGLWPMYRSSCSRYLQKTQVLK